MRDSKPLFGEPDSKKHDTTSSEETKKKRLDTRVWWEGRINYRWTQNSKKGRERSELIAHLCNLYGIEPSQHLFDRFLKHISRIEEDYYNTKAKIAELENRAKGLD